MYVCGLVGISVCVWSRKETMKVNMTMFTNLSERCYTCHMASLLQCSRSSCARKESEAFPAVSSPS